jgi:hypothetical protein
MTALNHARQFVAKLPQATIDEGGIELHEAVAHLSAVLAQFDERKPVGYAYHHTQNGQTYIRSELYPNTPDRARLYTAPPASPDLLSTVKSFFMGYLKQEHDDASLCCDAQHHRDICGLAAAIEREERGDLVATPSVRLMAAGDQCDEEVIGEPFSIEGVEERFAVHASLRSDHWIAPWTASHVDSGFAVARGDTIDGAIAAARKRWAEMPADRIAEAKKRVMAFRAQRNAEVAAGGAA